MVISIVSVGAWMVGAYSACAFGLLLFKINNKIIKRTQTRSQGSLHGLFEYQQRYVWVVKDGVEIEIVLDEVQAGDEVLVHAGQIIPVDGCVVDGIAAVDQRHLTGESNPVDKSTGDEVYCSCVITQGRLRIRVTKTGRQTLAAQISHILEHTTTYQFDIEQRGLQLADRMVVPALVAGGLVLPFYGAVTAESPTTGVVHVPAALQLQLDDARLTRAERGQPGQRFIQRQHVDDGRRLRAGQLHANRRRCLGPDAP